MYVLLITYDNDNIKHTQVLGIYTTEELANKALEFTFNKICGIEHITTFNEGSYFIGGNSFHLQGYGMDKKITCELVQSEVDNI